MIVTDKPMNAIKEALEAVRLAEASLHPATAPRWDKAEIEQARERASKGLLQAIELLQTLEKEGESK